MLYIHEAYRNRALFELCEHCKLKANKKTSPIQLYNAHFFAAKTSKKAIEDLFLGRWRPDVAGMVYPGIMSESSMYWIPIYLFIQMINTFVATRVHIYYDYYVYYIVSILTYNIDNNMMIYLHNLHFLLLYIMSYIISYNIHHVSYVYIIYAILCIIYPISFTIWYIVYCI